MQIIHNIVPRDIGTSNFILEQYMMKTCKIPVKNRLEPVLVVSNYARFLRERIGDVFTHLDNIIEPGRTLRGRRFSSIYIDGFINLDKRQQDYINSEVLNATEINGVVHMYSTPIKRYSLAAYLFALNKFCYNLSEFNYRNVDSPLNSIMSLQAISEIESEADEINSQYLIPRNNIKVNRIITTKPIDYIEEKKRMFGREQAEMEIFGNFLKVDSY